MPRVPGIDELAGSDTKAEHSDAQPAVATSGGVAVGVDATAQVSNLETKAAHVEDARLADLKNRADVCAEDWRRAASRLLGVGVLTGMVVERMRFDQQRSDVLGRYEQALREWQSYWIALEKGNEGQR